MSLGDIGVAGCIGNCVVDCYFYADSSNENLSAFALRMRCCFLISLDLLTSVFFEEAELPILLKMSAGPSILALNLLKILPEPNSFFGRNNFEHTIGNDESIFMPGII